MPMSVRTLCLGVLSRGPASGYEIRKHCEEGPFRHFFDAGFGSIYPALRKLAEEKLILGEEQAQVSKPDKIVYRLTEEGWRAFHKSLTTLPGPDRVKSDFLFILFFADQMDTNRLVDIIDHRLAWYQDEITRMRQCQNDMAASGETSLGESFCLGYGLALYQAAESYLNNNRTALAGSVGTLTL